MPKLFADFALQTRVVRLAGFALAPGELPIALEMHARLTSGHEEAPAAFDDRRDDGERHVARAAGASPSGRDRQIAARGQRRHFGFLAVQVVAPKSISA